MRLKRTVAKIKIKMRKRKAEKHEREMTKLGLARNKALKEARVAAERAGAFESKRKAQEKRTRALAPLEKARQQAREQRKKQAKKAVSGTLKALKPIYKIIKGK